MRSSAYDTTTWSSCSTTPEGQCGVGPVYDVVPGPVVDLAAAEAVVRLEIVNTLAGAAATPDLVRTLLRTVAGRRQQVGARRAGAALASRR